MKTFTMPYRGKMRKVRFRVGSYQQYGDLAIDIEVRRWPFHWECWDRLTVNIIPQIGPNFALIDTNKLGEDVVPWLEESNLAFSTRWAERSGFCMYPQVIFHGYMLKKADPKGYRRHLCEWDERNRFHATKDPADTQNF